jgi:hypothetical protein
MTETDWANYLVLWATEMTYQDALSHYIILFSHSDETDFGCQANSPIAALRQAKYAHPRLKPVGVMVLRHSDQGEGQWVQLEGVL